MPSGLSEEFVRIKSAKDKPSVVKQLIQSENEKAIIFTNAVNDATALNTLLREMEISSDELSSNLDDWKRKNAVKKFTKGNLQGTIQVVIIFWGPKIRISRLFLTPIFFTQIEE